MAIVKFNPAAFSKRFEKVDISSTPPEVIDMLWQVAEHFVDNTEGSIVPFDPEHGQHQRQILLYYAMAHLITLQQQAGDGGLPGLTTSATEGSVTISSETFKSNSFIAQWWYQTPYGATFWAMSLPYRIGTRVYVYHEPHPWG